MIACVRARRVLYSSASRPRDVTVSTRANRSLIPRCRGTSGNSANWRDWQNYECQILLATRVTRCANTQQRIHSILVHVRTLHGCVSVYEIYVIDCSGGMVLCNACRGTPRLDRWNNKRAATKHANWNLGKRQTAWKLKSTLCDLHFARKWNFKCASNFMCIQKNACMCVKN